MTSPLGSKKSFQLSAFSYQRRVNAGFTLMELLVVLAIIAVIGGLSASAFQLAYRSYSMSASASRVEGIIRAARNSAISSGIPSRAVIESHQATAYGFEFAGEWGFEEDQGGVVYGARRAPATLKGGASLGNGYAGRGLHLGGSGYADCGSPASFDFRAGVYAEAYVRIQSSLASSSHERNSGSAGGGLRRRPSLTSARSALNPGDASAVLSKKRSFFLGISPDGALEGRIGDFAIRSMPGTVIPHRWTKVALFFDGEEMLLLADGIDRETYILGSQGLSEEDELSPPPYIPRSQEPFLIGSPTALFQGSIDEVRLFGMGEPLRYELGGRTRILGWKKEIWFTGSGRLDSRYHELGIQLVMYEYKKPPPLKKKTKTKSINLETKIDYSLTYEEWAHRRGLPVIEGRQAAEEAKLLSKIPEARKIFISLDPSGALR